MCNLLRSNPLTQREDDKKLMVEQPRLMNQVCLQYDECFSIWHSIIRSCFLCNARFPADAAWIYDGRTSVTMRHDRTHTCKQMAQWTLSLGVNLILFRQIIPFDAATFESYVDLQSFTLSSTAVEPMRSNESLSQTSMCMVWRAR